MLSIGFSANCPTNRGIFGSGVTFFFYQSGLKVLSFRSKPNGRALVRPSSDCFSVTDFFTVVGRYAVVVMVLFFSLLQVSFAQSTVSSPRAGSTLSDSAQLFSWNNSGAALYQVWVGNAVGTMDIGAFPREGTTGTSTTVTGLPTDGRTLYVRLYSQINGQWSFTDTTYTAATPSRAAAVISSPATGSTLSGSSQLFSWNNSGAALYQVWVGNAVGTMDIGAFPREGTTGTSTTVTGLPTDGRTLYVRLYSQINGQWSFTDTTYTAATPSRAAAVISVNSTSLSFSQTVNTTSSAQAITVSNTGNAALTISAVTLTGVDASQFSQSNNCSSVAAGSSCAISVTFTPTSTGSKSASISISHNASGSPTTIALTGSGTIAFTISDISLAMNIRGFSESTVAGSMTATGTGGVPVKYVIQSQGAYGSATIDPLSGALTYSVADLLSDPRAASDRVVVRATAGGNSATANVNISFRSDPLLGKQWHLRSTGQYTLSDVRPVAGADINVSPAWESGYSGRGIKIGIVDSGLEIYHEDLSANVDAASSIDFRSGGTNPSNLSPDSTGDHGTKVAGIIGSVAFNGKGGRGVAYRSILRGYNWAYNSLTSSSQANFARSFGEDDRSRDNDVFNGSFGGDETALGVSYGSLPPFSPLRSTALNKTTSLRGGKGAVVVMSAGNNFATNNVVGACANAISFGVSCSSPAEASYKQSIVPIIVGALAADSKKSSYSNSSPSIWISAPGGEYGYEASFTGSGFSSDAYKPAIISTNSSGCANYSTSYNSLDSRGANSLATDCQYTAKMNGTSSAAPMVTGVVALMLEANPGLSYRDVAKILARTARRVDHAFTGVTASLAGAVRRLEAGWVMNSAGYYFSGRYGFGALDAGAAVEMARTYTSYLPPVQFIEADKFQAVGDVSIGSNGKFVTFQVSSSVTRVEKVFSIVNIFMRDTVVLGFSSSGGTCAQIELESPSGTKSILLNAANGFRNSILENVLLSSNAFYGENPNGTWKLIAYDWCAGVPLSPMQFSLLKPQEFGLTGH
jgi:subtilisin family serine protease